MKFEEVLDFLLSDNSSPTPDDLVHPTNESIQLNQKMLELSSALSGEKRADLWDSVAELMPWQQMEELFALENMLPEPEPEKEKALERKGIWSAEEKRLFLSGLEKNGPGKWKDISRHIGTRSPEQVRSYARRTRPMRSSIQDIQSLPPDTNRPIANPGHQPFPRTVYVPIMEPRVWASNVPPPIWWDLALLRPEHGLHYIYGNFGGSVCHPSLNLRAKMGANPSSRISDQVWNSTNTLSSDSCGCLPGPSAYGNNMYPGQ